MTGLPRIVGTGRKLRRAMSLPEVLLWQQLRLRPGGVKFRRQHAIGDYVLDFHCASARLAVEIDGFAHGATDRAESDEARDTWLTKRGIRGVRIAAAQVLADAPAIAAWLATTASATILPARGEVARSAGGAVQPGTVAPYRDAPVPGTRAAVPRPTAPPSRFAYHLPASGEDRAPLRGNDRAQGPAPCR